MKETVLLAFDFDGVIADSIQSAFDIYSKFLNRFNVDSSWEEFEEYNGMTLRDIIFSLKTKFDLAYEVEELYHIYFAMLNEEQKNIYPINGAVLTIKRLRKCGYRMVVSSSAPMEYIKNFLQDNEINNCFETVISGDSIGISKSSPDFYRFIRRMYSDYDVIVIEDSDSGLLSAFNARVKVVFFNERKRTTKMPFHHEITDFTELPHVVEELAEYGYFIKKDNIEIHLVKRPSNKLEHEKVELLWKNRAQGVFNGRAIAFDSYQYVDGKLLLKCYEIEYKYLYAAKFLNQNKEYLSAVGVSAICQDEDNNTILLQRNEVTDCPGRYELAPSGGIDYLNVKGDCFGYIRQIEQEFCEELGLGYYDALHFEISTMGLCYDRENNIFDICLKIKYKGKFKEIITDVNNKEYNKNSLIIGHFDDVYNQIADKQVVFSTRTMLRSV